MDSFAAFAHATAVSQTARSISGKSGASSCQEIVGEATPARASRRDWLLDRVGDLFLVTGAWLKARSAPANYQSA
jgi:hypothetical protein